MNSSGIKRGLAAGAISALAVTGLPFLASSANAVAGDSIVVTSTGPALNGGGVGAVVVLETKGITASDLKLASTNSSDANSQNNSDQSAEIIDANSVADPDHTGYDITTLHIKTTTSTTGNAATFRVFEDEANTPTSTTDPTPIQNDKLDASEARANVSVSTTGALSSIDVSPASQSAAQGINSGDYTVTLKDAAGRTTQLNSGEQINITTDDSSVSTDESGQAITAAEIDGGTDTFKGTSTGGLTPTATGNHTITLTGPGSSPVVGKATLTVTKAAQVTAGEVDIVTGADSWDGFGNGGAGANNGTTDVRVDQSSIRIDFKGDDKNSTVTLTATGTGLTFGGKSSTTVSTVLDDNGVGSITITPDAGTVQEGDSIAISGSFGQTLDFARAAATTIKPEADPFFGKVGGSTDVTATVLDQFGQPLTQGFVEAQRTDITNANTDADPQRKAVGSDGSVTFTFADKKATSGAEDTVDLSYYKDQYTPEGSPDISGDTATIKWTTDGMGSDYIASLDGDNTEATTYDPSDVSVMPLADTVADDEDPYGNTKGNESAELTVAQGETGSEMTVSVDNGALILEPGETKLSEGSTSVSGPVSDFVASTNSTNTDSYRIVGTKSGLVTVTMDSAHRTETAQMTVANESDTSSARNVAVSGPAEVEHGTTQIPFTAVVTDAFGNPIANYSAGSLNVQVTGPAQFQDGDAMTNADGQLNLNVRVDSDAVGDVAIRVQGLYGQFGAAADHLYNTSQSKDGEGLTASSNVANATTTVKDAPLPPVVELKSINLDLRGNDNGAKDDVLRANANRNGAGLTAKLYRKTSNGLKWLASAPLNSRGNHKFRVADENGNKATKYVVKVAKTDTTQHAYDSKKVR